MPGLYSLFPVPVIYWKGGGAVDLQEYRESDAEQSRTRDLLGLIPESGQSSLDIGARDGYFSRLLAGRFDAVVALDLEQPKIEHEKIQCVKGDVTDLEFDDNTFDFVFCAEVLEHIPGGQLATACSELSRVTKRFLLVGVPYQQDIRTGRTTCSECGGYSPPWGHVNRFDEDYLRQLFPELRVRRTSFVGKAHDVTNAFSVWLMDLAGNPYGTYMQDEACTHCGSEITGPSERNLVQKVLTKISWNITSLQRTMSKPHPNWIHVLFEKPI